MVGNFLLQNKGVLFRNGIRHVFNYLIRPLWRFFYVKNNLQMNLSDIFSKKIGVKSFQIK